MKQLFLIGLLIFFRFATAQVIMGTVVDEMKLPMPGASVFLDGTSAGTVTEADGTFSLTAKTSINTRLVVSMSGYETLTVDEPFGQPKFLFIMTPKSEELKQVVITSDGFSRKEKMQAFMREFLGDNRPGRSCTIKNPDDIELYYNRKTNKLTAKCENPILIRNDYLGYDIAFSLVDFFVEFNRYSLKAQDARKFFYAGTSSYSPLLGKPGKFEKNRNRSYKGSSMHFYRTLCLNEWHRDGFQLFDGSFQAAASDHFKIEETDQFYTVKLLTPNPVKVTGLSNPIPVNRSFNLLFDKSAQSRITFQADNLKVDKFGNLATPYDVMFSGEIGSKRLGHLLPLDYEAPEDIE